MDNNDEAGDLEQLDAIDKEHGVNTPMAVEVEKESITNSLGKASNYLPEDVLSEAADNGWKSLTLELLPSQGMFYPSGVELLLKSAKTDEIKHWSTMDELDPLDVKEKINFILSKCTNFKIKNQAGRFNFNDYCDVDKYHILFRIHELTFPNKENKLMANLRCKSKSCGHVNRIHVTSQNLIGYRTPDHLMQWYDSERRGFFIPADMNKLNEDLKFFIPTTGMVNKFKEYKKKEKANGNTIDEAFYEVVPYLITDWRNVTPAVMRDLKISFKGWSKDKYIAVYKFVNEIKKSSLNKAIGVCEKCKTRLEDHIFLGGSFTTKDIFIVSAGFNEFIGA